MSARPPHAVLMPTPVEAGHPHSVATATYRTDHELAFYLRALRHVATGRLVVVLGLRDGNRVDPEDMPAGTRLIQTAHESGLDPDDGVGWFVPDPVRAVVVALTGLRSDEGVIVLLPDDWQGSPAEELVEKARRWRAGPHSPEDDVHFDATHPN
ncbi:MAG TPA: hypothetical protein VM597_13605 [Gemmataceae bacterium]|nr:hypothetical protein [Gemmataceae bacterium]